MRGFAVVRLMSCVSLGFLLGSCDSKPSITRDKVQEAWDDYNNPAQLDSGAIVVFSDLPSSGVSLKLPWADIYWPSHLGGIALRWVNGIETPFAAVRPTEEQVRSMSQAELAALSPAEKYDIFMGRFDFPTVQAELLRTHPAMPTWTGLCHGWASATLNFDEPAAVTMRGATGVDIPFASGDVKALLSYAQGVVFLPVVKALGQRCDADLTNMPHMRNTAACRDTNAGSFHLILANSVGRAGQSVIADLTRDAQVWNFPIYGYSTRELLKRPPSLGASPQAVTEVVVETDVDFIAELERPNWLPLVDSRNYTANRVTYQYAVELDALGRVVGGSWISEDRPDFLWVQERADFRGYYGSIESIYDSAVRAGTQPSGPSPSPVPTAAPEPTLPPVPTPPPTVTPPPVPTIPTPQPPPVLDPGQPIGPVLTQPIPVPTEPVGSGADSNPRTPVPPQSDANIALNCPVGTSIVAREFLFCSNGERAYAPITAAMYELCRSTGQMGCHEPLWSNELYSAMRGNAVCPLGAVWNERVSACAENNNVLGPFSAKFTEDCLASGFGNICHTMKIDLTYFTLVVRRN